MRGGAQARFLARRADLGAGAKTVLVVVGRVGPHEPPLRGSLPLLPRPTFSPLRAPKSLPHLQWRSQLIPACTRRFPSAPSAFGYEEAVLSYRAFGEARPG